MTITDSLIPVNKYNRPGTKSSPKRICVHYTGDCGASAARLAQFWKNVAAGKFPDKPNSWTSAQYIVGLDGEVIRCVPDGEIAYAATNQNAENYAAKIRQAGFNALVVRVNNDFPGALHFLFY